MDDLPSEKPSREQRSSVRGERCPNCGQPLVLGQCTFCGYRPGVSTTPPPAAPTTAPPGSPSTPTPAPAAPSPKPLFTPIPSTASTTGVPPAAPPPPRSA